VQTVSEGYCGWNLFSMLGVKPFADGCSFRGLSNKGTIQAVMITEALWEEGPSGRFPNVIGQP